MLAEVAGGKPLWITELGVTSGDAAGFLSGVKGWLDGDARVERWAWFLDSVGDLVVEESSGTGTGAALSALGKFYTTP